MEPRTSRPARRLAAVEALARAGVSVGVMIAPVIPGLNDHELPSLISAAAEAGAGFAAYTPARLPRTVRPLFEDWLARRFPERKEKALNRIRAMRGGLTTHASSPSERRRHLRGSDLPALRYKLPQGWA
jgi:DNA repair photolyase